MYAKEYEQKHPKVLQARSCHGNVGDHRSAVGLANIHVEISCDHTKDIKLNYPPMAWNINDNALGSQNHGPKGLWVFFYQLGLSPHHPHGDGLQGS